VYLLRHNIWEMPDHYSAPVVNESCRYVHKTDIGIRKRFSVDMSLIEFYSVKTYIYCNPNIVVSTMSFEWFWKKDVELGLVNASATVLIIFLKRLNSVFIRCMRGFVPLSVFADTVGGIELL